MGLRRQPSSREPSRSSIVVIRSPLRRDDDTDSEDWLKVDVRWWGECVVLIAVVSAVILRMPGVPLVDRLAVLACLVGGIAMASIAVASQHLHFCRVSNDTGVASGATLVPLVLLVLSATHPEQPRWRGHLWLSVAMTASMLLWLAAVKVSAYLDKQVADPKPHDSAAGVASYGLAWAHATGRLGRPVLPVVAAAYGTAMFGLITRGLASTVPASFTLGEATVLTQATVVLLQELCAVAAGESSVLGGGGPSGAPARVTACLLAGAAFLILTWLPATLWISRRGQPAATASPAAVAGGAADGSPRAGWLGAVRPWPFLTAMAVAVVSITLPLTSVVLGEDSARWLLGYVGGQYGHLGAVVYWVTLLATGVPVISAVSASWLIDAPVGVPGGSEPNEPPLDSDEDDAEPDGRARLRRLQLACRKLYHVLALGLFVPVLLLDPEFLGLGCAAALFCMVALECFRVADVPTVGPFLHELMERYRDEKDPGELLTTHIYLLAGCAVPLWLAGPSAPATVTGIGLVAVGVGDAVAAVVGSTFGSHKIFNTSKTVEGTVASAIAQLVAIAALHAATAVDGAPPLATLAVGVGVAAVYEALTLQSDNLVVPLIMWAVVASEPGRAAAL